MMAKQHACCKTIASTIAAHNFALRHIYRWLFDYFALAIHGNATFGKMDGDE